MEKLFAFLPEDYEIGDGDSVPFCQVPGWAVRHIQRKERERCASVAREIGGTTTEWDPERLTERIARKIEALPER